MLLSSNINSVTQVVLCCLLLFNIPNYLSWSLTSDTTKPNLLSVPVLFSEWREQILVQSHYKMHRTAVNAQNMIWFSLMIS